MFAGKTLTLQRQDTDENGNPVILSMSATGEIIEEVMFVCAFVFFFPMGLFSFRLDKVLGILFIAISIMSLAIIAMTPTSYVFSKKGVVIRYIFGLEENIMWTKVLSVMTELEISSRFYVI